MKKLSAFLLLPVLLISVSLPAFAVGSSGFENATFSAQSLGGGIATVAQADDPSTISYNPAGIVNLKGVQAQTNSAFISVFTRHRSPSGDVNQSAGTISYIPTGYLTINPGDYFHNRLAIGVGSDSPFGLANKYDSNQPWVRYTGWRNYLKMYTIKPVAAIKVNDKLSIGAGPIYYRIFDFGGIQAYPNVLLGGAFPDGQVRVNLSGNTWGWHMGILAKPHPKHQLGFYFRSPVTVHTRGRIKVENATVGGRFETGANAKVDLPLNFTWAYAYKATSKLTVETDLGYTRWSAHKRLYINADHVDASNDAILAAIGKADKDYSDAFTLHLGGKYEATDRLTLRSGAVFFWSAVPQDHFIPAVPDSNSLAASLGVGYKLTRYLSADVAYFQRFWLRRKIDNNISETLGTSVDGRYSSSAQEFVVSLTYLWDGAFERKGSAKVETSQLSS